MTWANYLTLLSFSFLICEVGTREAPASQGAVQVELRRHKVPREPCAQETY